MGTDYQSFYEPVARSILAGRGFRLEDQRPATRYPPGYPLLLASLFGLSAWLNLSEGVMLSAFALLGMGLTSILVFSTARTVWGVRPALASSLIWMTYPGALWLTKQPNSEIPFVLVFYGTLSLFWSALLRQRRAWPVYFLCGLLAGVAMLIRPMAIGVGLVMAAMLWLASREAALWRRLMLTGMLLLGNLAVIFPWQAWVYAQTGSVVLLSTGGAPSMRDGLTFGINSKAYRQGSQAAPQDVAALMQDISARYDGLQSVGNIASLMAEELRARPLAVAKLLAIKLARSWYGTDSQQFEAPIMLIQVIYLLLALWGSQVAWRQGGAAKWLAVMIGAMVLYFWGMTVLVLSILRYMVPVMGLLFTLIPGGFYTHRGGGVRHGAL